jgi:hypothetical protein
MSLMATSYQTDLLSPPIVAAPEPDRGIAV